MGIIFRTFRQRHFNMNNEGKWHYRWITQLKIWKGRGISVHIIFEYSIFWTGYKEEKDSKRFKYFLKNLFIKKQKLGVTNDK